MLDQISGYELIVQQKESFINKPTELKSHKENLVLERDFPTPRGLTQLACAEVPASARRDATEGSLLVRKMSTSCQQSGLQQQTTFGTGNKVQIGERMKNINFNVAADKFLIGTVDALAYKEGLTLIAAEPGKPGSCGHREVISDVDNAARFSPSTTSGHNEGSSFNYGSEELCSAQKKSRPNPRPSRPPLLPPCRVCGDRASGYHYGVNTCEACKGFFRRSICKTEPYVCTGSGDCKTLAGKRTACSHCRFRRCIDVGMSKNAIKTGRYTHELRSRNILEVKRLQKQASDESPDRTSVESSSSDTNYTEYKNDLLRKSMLEATLAVLVTGQKMLYEFLDDYYNDDLIRERQFSVYRNYMNRKGRLLLQTESPTTQPYRFNTDTRHSHAQPERLTTGTPYLTTQTKCLTTDTKQFQTTAECLTTNAEYLIKKTGEHVARNEVYNSQARPSGLPTTSQTEFKSSSTESATQGRNKIQNVLLTDISGSHTNIENTDLSLCAKKHEDVSAQESSIEGKVTEDVDRIKLQSHETVIDTGNNAAKKVDISIIQSTESLRAEVMSKIINDLEQGVQGMLAFAKSLPGFSDLPSQDQVSLVKAARFDIWYIGHIRCFNVELRVGACEWQFHADELAQVWGNPMVDLAFTLSRVAQTLQLTKHETAALRAVCLTFPDRCMDLQNRQEVEQMHADMLDVFKYVSCKRHSDYNKWLTKVINFLVLLREFGVKFEAVSSKLTLDWDVLKDNPVLLSVFLS